MGPTSLTAWAFAWHPLGMKTYPLLLVLALAVAPAVARADAPAFATLVEDRANLLALTQGWSRLMPARGDDPARAALRARLEQLQAGVNRPEATHEELRRHRADFTRLQQDIMAYLYQAYPRDAGTSYREFAAGAEIVAGEYALREQPRAREAAARLESLRPRLARGLTTEPAAFFDGSGSASFRLAADAPRPIAPVVAKAPARVRAPEPPAAQGAARYAALRAALLARGVDARIIDTAIAEGLRQRVDPAIVLSVIEQESRFRRTAYNRGSGCVGLMQLDPATARDMGVRDASMLYDIRTNIRAGVRYLNWIANDFFRLNLDLSDVERVSAVRLQQVLAAYNWGIGNVQRVVRRSGAAALEAVAPRETRNYISEIPGRIAAWASSFF